MLQLGTTRYDDDIALVKKAMINIESLCSVPGATSFGAPVSRFGWTFFNISVKQEFLDAVQQRFSDMISRYRGNALEKFLAFLGDYIKARGCEVRIKLIEH